MEHFRFYTLNFDYFSRPILLFVFEANIHPKGEFNTIKV